AYTNPTAFTVHDTFPIVFGDLGRLGAELHPLADACLDCGFRGHQGHQPVVAIAPPANIGGEVMSR
ncbi:MAG: hypothetical protein ACRER5_16915, partial [Pseudomonas sp.]